MYATGTAYLYKILKVHFHDERAGCRASAVTEPIIESVIKMATNGARRQQADVGIIIGQTSTDDSLPQVARAVRSQRAFLSLSGGISLAPRSAL